MQQRRGTAAQWTAANPVLAAGEIGFETDTNQFKIGDGVNLWAALSYFKNLEDLGGSLDDYILVTARSAANGVAPLDADGEIPLGFMAKLIDGADSNLNTLRELGDVVTALGVTSAAHVTHVSSTTNVHGIADTQALATKDYADGAISTHNTDTTGVHGIENTALLATKSYADSAVSTHNDDTTNVHGIADTSVLTTVTQVNSSISTHNADTTEVHGILDTSVLATATTVATAKEQAIENAGLAADTKISTAIGLLTKTSVGLANVDNTADSAKPISTATQTALDAKLASATAASTYAPLASPTFTGTVVLPTVTAGGSIVPGTDNTYDLGSPTKMWKDIYVGPGSLYVNGQKVIQDESGAIVISADADENLGLRTSGSGNIELDPTGTGSVLVKGPLVVEAGANFSSADGNGITFSNGLKSDTLASKTLNTDLSLSGNGTGKVYLNDNAEVNGNLVVTGNFTVSGTTVSVNTETISLADNIIDLNSNFTTGTPTENSGLRIMRGDSNAVQVRWNESTDKWEFTNDGTNYSVIAPTDSPTFTGTVTIPAGASISGFAPLASPTFTGTVTVAASGVAFTDGTQTKEGVPSQTPIIQKTASYTLSALTERDDLIEMNSASALTLTIPPASSVDYPIGTSLDILQTGAGQVTIAAGAGVTVNATPGLKLRTQWSSATLFKRAANTWVVFGDLTA